MGEIYKITDGTSSIDISPIRGQNEPEARGREILRGKDGKEDVHEWGGTDVYETPFNNVSEAEADLLIDWWVNMTTLTFTPDLQGDPGTTLEVKIAEVARPMQVWGGDWDTLFAGMLTLYGISSMSFSSSSQSVSGSTSCSSLSDSSSCSTGSSLSCSVFLSVSRSSMASESCSPSGSVSAFSCDDPQESSSCSTFVSISEDSSSEGRSCSTASLSQSCARSTSDSVSCSESEHVFDINISLSSCSEDASDVSCSFSEGSQSCSESGAG